MARLCCFVDFFLWTATLSRHNIVCMFVMVWIVSWKKTAKSNIACRPKIFPFASFFSTCHICLFTSPRKIELKPVVFVRVSYICFITLKLSGNFFANLRYFCLFQESCLAGMRKVYWESFCGQPTHKLHYKHTLRVFLLTEIYTDCVPVLLNFLNESVSTVSLAMSRKFYFSFASWLYNAQSQYF